MAVMTVACVPLPTALAIDALSWRCAVGTLVGNNFSVAVQDRLPSEASDA
jgi:hypothetical protein